MTVVPRVNIKQMIPICSYLMETVINLLSGPIIV